MNNFTILSENQWYSIPKEKEANFRILIGQRRNGRAMNTGFFVNDSGEIRLVGIFLKSNITAFYHSDNNSGGAWKIQNTIENMIWTLKNDVDSFPERLPNANQQLSSILNEDLPKNFETNRKKQTYNLCCSSVKSRKLL
ncbi:MAG: hypothetical protein QM541_16920 [Flavobacterium sp.]|nr:hypothetical protein [Flavobacterium sp.]